MLSGPVSVDAELPVDGVADAPLQRPDRFFAAVAFGDLAVVVGAAGTVAMADLGDGGHVDGVGEATVAAPRQPEHVASPLSRGHTSIGAVPLSAANRSRLGKRLMSATSPMMVAATIGPTPNRPVSVVLDALTAAVIRCLVSRSWSSRRHRSATSSEATA